MNTSLKLAGFTAVLAVAFGGAAVAGDVIDPDRGEKESTMSTTHSTHDEQQTPTTTAPAAKQGDGGHGAHGGAAAGAQDADAVRGLAVAQDDLRVVVERPELTRGKQERVAFRIERADGEPVTQFDVEHERRMHLIVVRRDLTGFQHLHPTMAADGTWSAPIELPDAGSYRLFADFSHDGEARTLASDLRVDGPADLRDLPAPAPLATSDGGDRVALANDHGDDEAHAATAGEPTALRFEITRDGKPVEVEPYLGASGHLVALREGDLAFLHVHPSGDGVEFETTFPTAGRYRLFLQYKVDGRVQTAAFTQEVAR